MKNYTYTKHFEDQILRKRPYLKKEWCIRVIENHEKTERQDNNRFHFWKRISELDGHYLRVTTFENKTTIHNAFPDRRFEL